MFNDATTAWGSLISKMLREGVIEKCLEKPLKNKNVEWFYYKLSQQKFEHTTPKNKEEFLIFDNEIMKFEHAIGEV